MKPNECEWKLNELLSLWFEIEYKSCFCCGIQCISNGIIQYDVDYYRTILNYDIRENERNKT